MPPDGSFNSRDLVLSGWVGQHPENGRDVAHLLLFPATGAVTEAMPLVAEILGLVPARQAPVIIDETAVLVAVGNGAVRLFYADGNELSRPITLDWARAALDQKVVVLTCGMDPWTGADVGELDRYLARLDRLFIGLVAVQG